MRNPKFRAWDSKNKKFPFVGFHVIGECTAFDLLNQYRLEEYNDLVIEQWTGLKDKNGKDIYEGDIVRQTCDNKPCDYLVEWNEHGGDYCGFALRALMKNTSTFRYTVHDFAIYLAECFEVIGNLHENNLEEKLEEVKSV